jgi:hypothetical protein
MTQEASHLLVPISKWDDYYDWPSVSAMRHYAHRSKTNGLDPAFLKFGSRKLVDADKFFNLVRARSGNASTGKEAK